MGSPTKVASPAKPPDDRLAELGLTADILRDSLEEGWRVAADCTKHDPPNLPGIIVWGKTIRHLRDRLVPAGWRSNNTMNYATVISPDRKTALGVAAGDECTGRDGLTPCTRSPKGPATRRALDRNQLTFSDFADHFPKPARRLVTGLQRQTWLLLHYVDEDEGEIRLELSLPSEMDDQGRIVAWRERIVLEPIPRLPEALPGGGTGDERPEVEVNIERRAGGQD
jgi:hypothetical protein